MGLYCKPYFGTELPHTCQGLIYLAYQGEHTVNQGEIPNFCHIHVSFSKICFCHLLSAEAELPRANIIYDVYLQILNDYYSRVLEKVTRYSAVNSAFSVYS